MEKILFAIYYLNPYVSGLHAQVYYDAYEGYARSVKEYRWNVEAHRWECVASGVCIYAPDEDVAREYISRWLHYEAVTREQDAWFDSYIGEPWKTEEHEPIVI